MQAAMAQAPHTLPHPIDTKDGYSLPPGAEPPAPPYQAVPTESDSFPSATDHILNHHVITDEPESVTGDVLDEATAEDSRDETAPEMRQYESPLAGLPPLLVPTASSGKRHAPQPIHTSDLHSSSEFLDSRPTPNSAPPTHSTFQLDLANAPALPPIPQNASSPGPGTQGSEKSLKQESLDSRASPITNGSSPNGDPVTVYRQPGPPSAYAHTQQIKNAGSKYRPKASSRAGSTRSMQSATSGFPNQPSIHVIASSHNNALSPPRKQSSSSLAASYNSAGARAKSPNLSVSRAASPRDGSNASSPRALSPSPAPSQPLAPPLNRGVSSSSSTPQQQQPTRPPSSKSQTAVSKSPSPVGYDRKDSEERSIPSLAPPPQAPPSVLAVSRAEEEPSRSYSPSPSAHDTKSPLLGPDGSVLNRPKPKPKLSLAYRAQSPTTYQADRSFSPSKTNRMASSSSSGGMLPPLKRTGARGLDLEDVLVEDGVQNALFGHLSIASFLALMTAVRKSTRQMVSGEVVGTWVTNSWGMYLQPHEVPQWPGLGVWEGFLESLLHNAEAYNTYPPHFKPLLQHLCLSYSLVVLFLRTLPIDAHPSTPPFPFEDEQTLQAAGMPKSVSNLSIASTVPNRRGPGSGWELGMPSKGPMHVPKAERPIELVMPEPLGAPKNDLAPPRANSGSNLSRLNNLAMTQKHKRRSSIGGSSFVSWTSGKKGGSGSSILSPALPSSASFLSSSDKKLPPVSFPSAKRYVFTGYGNPTHPPRSKTMSESGSRPGSIFTVEESIAPSRSRYGASSIPSLPRFSKRSPSGYTDQWGGGPHSGGGSRTASVIGGRPGGAGRNSPSLMFRLGSMGISSPDPSSSRLGAMTPDQIEPAFDRPIPYVVGRAPILRVFVPLCPEVPSWPCAEGARRARRELERCGAWGKLRIGDIVVNTALREPLLPRHLMLYIPTMEPFLCPLEYKYAEQGHLPGYLDAFKIPPSFYYPLLFAGRYVIHLDLGPWADEAADTLRLAFARSDITTTRGDKVSAKRYLHVVGFEISPQSRHHAAEEWFGMVSIEAEGTAEGRNELLRRLGRGPEGQKMAPHKGPFEILRDKSLGGNIWLRLISETESQLR